MWQWDIAKTFLGNNLTILEMWFVSCGGSGEKVQKNGTRRGHLAWAISAEDSVFFEKYFKFG